MRCFEDGDVTHVEGAIDPVRDAEIIETELMLADLESVERRLANLSRKVRGGDKEAVTQDRLLKAAAEALETGRPARVVAVDAEDDAKAWRMLQLITSKPVLYVLNVAEGEAATGNAQSARMEEKAAGRGRRDGRDLGPDRGGDRPAAAPRTPRCSSARWGWRSRGSTG